MKTKYGKKKSLKQHRIFSEAVKKQTVCDIEQGKCTVLEASRELQVSDQSIYNWIYRYSRYLQKNKLLVVEDKSEAYRSKELEKQIRELEAALGRKQMELELLNKIIDLANEEYKADLKKNFSNQPSSGSESTKG
jgi:transposase-like protein